MEQLTQSAFRRRFRAYLAHRDDRQAREAVIETIPKRNVWFFCEVDGQDYAVRVLRTGSVEIMDSIFSQRQKEALALPLFREDWL